LAAEIARLRKQQEEHKRQWAAVTGKRMDTGPIRTRSGLQWLIVKHFDMQELMQLCFDIGVMWDLLPGDALDAKARELVLKMERENRIYKLIGECEKARPNVDWPSPWDVNAPPVSPST
jgi:hypothetical protein